MSTSPSTTAPRTVRRGAVAVVAVTAAALAAVALPTPAGAATTTVAFGANAYATAVNLGNLQAGKTAVTPMCTTNSGYTRTNRTAGVTVPGLGSVGAVSTTVASDSYGSTRVAGTSTYTAATSLFGGILKLGAVQTLSQVTSRAGTITMSGTTSLLGLTIAGQSMPVHPAKNMVIPIPGIATITLNKQATSTAAGQHLITVVALEIDIVANPLLNQKAGSILIGKGTASLSAPLHHSAAGTAYGTYVSALGLVNSGATAAVYLPCGGGNVRRTNNVASVNIPGVITVGAVSTVGASSDSASATVAHTRSTVAGVDLLAGKVRISALVAESAVTRKNGKLTYSAAGTSFGSITVMGKAQSANPPANTAIPLPGIGTLYLNRQSRSGHQLHVFGLELILNTATGGLAKGTVIAIASAQSTVD